MYLEEEFYGSATLTNYYERRQNFDNRKELRAILEYNGIVTTRLVWDTRIHNLTETMPTRSVSSKYVPLFVPHIYSSCSNISAMVLNGLRSRVTVRKAIKFPQYVATSRTMNSHQNVTIVRPESAFGRTVPPEGRQSI